MATFPWLTTLREEARPKSETTPSTLTGRRLHCVVVSRLVVLGEQVDAGFPDGAKAVQHTRRVCNISGRSLMVMGVKMLEYEQSFHLGRDDDTIASTRERALVTGKGQGARKRHVSRAGARSSKRKQICDGKNPFHIHFTQTRGLFYFGTFLSDDLIGPSDLNE
jgi:hypothetical protein